MPIRYIAWMRIVSVLACLGLLLGLAGCGSDDDNGARPINEDLLRQAIAATEDILGRLAQSEEVTEARVANTLDLWNRAHNSSGRSDPRSAFGLSLFTMSGGAIDSLNALGVDWGDTGSDGAMNRSLAAPALLAMRTGALMVSPVTAAGNLLNDPRQAVVAAVPPLLNGDLSGADSRQDDEQLDPQAVIAELRQRFLPAVQRAVELMDDAAQPVAGTPAMALSFTFTDADGNEQTLLVGPTEARLMLGIMQLMEALSHDALVYDVSGWATPVITDDELADQQLTPDEYLPEPPFLTLMDNGDSHSQAGLNGYRNAIDNLQAAWNLISSTDLLFGQDLSDLLSGVADGEGGLSEAEQGAVTDVLNELEALFAGRYEPDLDLLRALGVRLDEEDEALIPAINLPAFANSPPSDLRDLLPTLGFLGTQADRQYYMVGSHDAVPARLRITAGDAETRIIGDWPDSNGDVTFGGLFDGLAESTLIDNLVVALQLTPNGDGTYEAELRVVGNDEFNEGWVF